MDNGHVDPFNAVSDAFILTILLLLPLKEAARTSLLSKRWEKIWRRLTRSVDYSQNFFDPPLIPHETLEHYSEDADIVNEFQRLSFDDFAEKWVTGYQEYRRSESSSNLEQTMKLFITEGIGELDLNFSHARWKEDCPPERKALLKLPSQVYEQELLRPLNLSEHDFKFSRFRMFYTIREIALSWVKITTPSLLWLISSCKSLEILSLKNCMNLNEVDISGNGGLKLRRLSIVDCVPLEDGITISFETLRFFKYKGFQLCSFILENLKSLEEAELDFWRERKYQKEIGDSLHNYILHELWAAEVLSVCSYTTQVLSNVNDDGLALHVKHLTLKTGLSPREFKGIVFILNCCPTLEQLTIEMGKTIQLNGFEDPREDMVNFWGELPDKRRPTLDEDGDSEDEDENEEQSDDEDGEDTDGVDNDGENENGEDENSEDTDGDDNDGKNENGEDSEDENGEDTDGVDNDDENENGEDTDGDDNVGEDEDGEDSEDENGEDSEYETFHFLNNLKIVKLEGFTGTHYEIEFLKYLLKVSNALEKMIINTSTKADEEQNAENKQKAKTLLDLYKASATADILIQ